jgi:hypothetical protein
MRINGVVAGMALCLTAGLASAQTPAKTVHPNPNGQAGQPIAGCLGPAVVPYENACQPREFSNNPLGRLGAWLTYRPLYRETPCEAQYTVCCKAPLYSYFTASRYNRCYEPYNCGPNSCGTGLFGGLFGRRSCDSACDDRGPATICITLPRITFSRGAGACTEAPAKCAPAPACGPAAGRSPAIAGGCDPCADRCLKLPRPIVQRGCDNSSAGGGVGFFGRLGAGFCGLSGGRYSGCGCGVGACGIGGGLLHSPLGRQCCGGDVCKIVDLNNLPILPPNTNRNCDTLPKHGFTTIAPPVAVEQMPAVRTAEPLPPAKPVEKK